VEEPAERGTANLRFLGIKAFSPKRAL